jgi:hypothetical protein
LCGCGHEKDRKNEAPGGTPHIGLLWDGRPILNELNE